MAEYSKEFLEKTIKIWQAYSPYPLSLDDAREIIENMAGLFKLLYELDEKYNKKEEKI